jgi:hypothetical protein
MDNIRVRRRWFYWSVERRYCLGRDYECEGGVWLEEWHIVSKHRSRRDALTAAMNLRAPRNDQKS